MNVQIDFKDIDGNFCGDHILEVTTTTNEQYACNLAVLEADRILKTNDVEDAVDFDVYTI